MVTPLTAPGESENGRPRQKRLAFAPGGQKGSGKLVAQAPVERLTKHGAVFLEVTRDIERRERVLDDAGVALVRMQHQSCGPRRNGKLIRSLDVIESGKIEAAVNCRVRDAVTDLQWIVVPGEIQISKLRFENFRTNTGRTFVTEFQRKSKWLGVLNVHVDDALSGNTAGL